MAITPDQVQALKVELQAWMAQNGLDGGCEWVTPEEFAARPCFREGSLEFGSPCLLVLIMGKFLYNAIGHTTPGEPSSFHDLRTGFSEIVYRHGFCFDFENAGRSGPGDAMFLKEYYDELSPEERAEIEHQYVENRKFIDEHVGVGWIWDDKAHTLTHPDDPEIQYWINPHTYKQILSKKLAEQAKAAIIRQIKSDRGEPVGDGQ
jgi:hypothetical protein